MTALETKRLEFQPSNWRAGVPSSDAVGIRNKDRRVLLVSSVSVGGEYDFDQIVSAELDFRFSSRSRTTGGFSLTRFIVGGLLTGGAGAVVGGLSGVKKTHTESFLSAIVLKVVTQREVSRSVHLINLFRSIQPLGEAEEQREEARAEDTLALLQGVINSPAPATAVVSANALGPMPSEFVDQVDWRLKNAGWRTRREAKAVGQRHVLIFAIRGSDKTAFACLPEAVTGYAFDQLSRALAAFAEEASLAIVGETLGGDVVKASASSAVSAMVIEQVDGFQPTTTASRFAF